MVEHTHIHNDTKPNKIKENKQQSNKNNNKSTWHKKNKTHGYNRGEETGTLWNREETVTSLIFSWFLFIDAVEEDLHKYG